jgi:hypothetical protein
VGSEIGPGRELNSGLDTLELKSGLEGRGLNEGCRGPVGRLNCWRSGKKKQVLITKFVGIYRAFHRFGQAKLGYGG